MPPYSHLHDATCDSPILVGSVPPIEQYRRFFPESFIEFIQKNRLGYKALPEIQRILKCERELQGITRFGAESPTKHIQHDIRPHHDALSTLDRLIVVDRFYHDPRNRTCDFLLSQPNWDIPEFDRKTIAAHLGYLHGCRTLFDLFIIAGMDESLLHEQNDDMPPHYYTGIHCLHTLSIATLDEVAHGTDADPFIEDDWLGDHLYDAPWIRHDRSVIRTKTYIALVVICILGTAGVLAGQKYDIAARIQAVGNAVGHRFFGSKHSDRLDKTGDKL